MAHGPQRPPPFQPGTKLSEHYIVEGLVRLSEGRMYYLANDGRTDRPFRFCWSCGADNTPRNGTHCLGCGVEMTTQRFLVCARWNSEEFEPFTRFFEKQLAHPQMITPIDLFVQADLLCSIIPWDGESLLVDDASPIPSERIWNLAEQSTGLIAFLQNEGIALRNLRPANYLIREDEGAMLFDLEVQEVFGAPVPEKQRGREVAFLGEMLRRYTPPAAPRLRSFFQQTQDGSYTSPLVFGRALEQLIDEEFQTDATSNAVTMTDVGLIRIMNEDNWNWVQLANEIMLYVVADGMGGHQCGEVASCMAVDTICQVARSRLEILSEVTSDTLENTLDEAFQASNNAIKDHSERMGNDMGTTLVAALVMRNELALIANVGDS
ncbi:MAG: protein phosphatase 2C domain-containing protein, partial [Myxococcota bacterium]|nr:protein phosphatase 2C domain-containing protein [Myxococcota bacterium]